LIAPRRRGARPHSKSQDDRPDADFVAVGERHGGGDGLAGEERAVLALQIFE